MEVGDFEVGLKVVLKHAPNMFSVPIIVPCTIIEIIDSVYVKVDTELQKGITIKKKFLQRSP